MAILPVAQYSDPLLSQPTGYNPGLSFLQGASGAIKLRDQLQLLRQRAALAPIIEKQQQAKTGLIGAQTDVQEQTAKFMPLKTALAAAQGAQSSSRFGAAYQLAKSIQALPAPARQAWIAGHTEKWNAIQDILTNKALQNKPSYAQQAVTSLMQQVFPRIHPSPQNQIAGISQTPGIAGGAATLLPNMPQTMPQGAPPYPPSMQPNVTQSSPQGVPGAPPSGVAGTPSSIVRPVSPGELPTGAPFAPYTAPKTVEDLQTTNQYLANRGAVGKQMNTRADNAVQLETWLTRNRALYSKRINNVLQYGGALGRGKRYAEEWANKNPQALSDYDWYKTTFMTGLSNAQKLMDAMGSTDQQKKELQTMINQIDNVSSNPGRIKRTLNKMFGTWQQISGSVLNAAEPIYKGTYRKKYGLAPSTGNYLDGGVPAPKGVLNGPGQAAQNNDPLGIR